MSLINFCDYSMKCRRQLLLSYSAWYILNLYSHFSSNFIEEIFLYIPYKSFYAILLLIYKNCSLNLVITLLMIVIIASPLIFIWLLIKIRLFSLYWKFTNLVNDSKCLKNFLGLWIAMVFLVKERVFSHICWKLVNNSLIFWQV
jgi:hypothetical protein